MLHLAHAKSRISLTPCSSKQTGFELLAKQVKEKCWGLKRTDQSVNLNYIFIIFETSKHMFRLKSVVNVLNKKEKALTLLSNRRLTKTR